MKGKSSYPEVSQKFINELIDTCDKDRVKWDEDSKMTYGRDETENLHFSPEVVVIPETTEEVSSVVKMCNSNGIPITTRGAGTGLSGGALPIFGGVILSMERMNKIIEIDELNFQVMVQPGVITQVLQEAVEEKGLFYPPDPASRGSCFIGGNLAENSGGPKAVKYGVTKDFVLDLEVVLANGEVIQTGAAVLKNATGYNLTQLFVGSEGTLGVITKAVLRLIPMPKYDLLMLVPFRSAVDACRAVNDILLAGFTPSGLEFMERDALTYGAKYVNDLELTIDEDIDAHLLIEVDGNQLEELQRDMEGIYNALEKYDCGEILMADNSAQKNRLWKLRRSLGEAVKAHSIYKEEDTVVPRGRLPQLLEGVKEIGQRYGFQSVCYGHAGDGNLHVNIIKGDMSDEKWNNELDTAISEIFELCVELGGTISGEHGIGLVQKKFMHIPFSQVELDLQRNIKSLFDPNNIMNPGKIF